jgi:transcriptional regulator with XRE-family HTH domain
MLNTESFLKRLEEIMLNNQLSAAAFAERIGVQRSSVSHILSRRNKPSLDFMLKIHEHFREIDLDWLILGNSKQNTSSPPELLTEGSLKISGKASGTEHHNTEVSQEKVKRINSSFNKHISEEIIQIIQLHKNGTFSIYIPNS